MSKKGKKFQGQRRPIRPTFTAPPPPTINTSYRDAATVVTRQFKSLQLVLAGCGGNGAYAAQHIGRLATVISGNGVDVQITLADPDVVNEVNLGRQLFWHYDLGEAKAIACARRYGRDWGTRTMAFVGEYNESLLLGTDLTVLVGCVDGASGRVALAEPSSTRPVSRRLPRSIQINFGNSPGAL
jgi:tRNA A37 threonylcarbamoyladenosine dehydratase